MALHYVVQGHRFDIGASTRPRRFSESDIFSASVLVEGVSVSSATTVLTLSLRAKLTLWQWGCNPTVYWSIPGFVVVWVPQILLSVGTAFYASE